MTKYIRKNIGHPTNDCVKFTTQNGELRNGTSCERTITGGETICDGYLAQHECDGYAVEYQPESDCPISPETAGVEKCPQSLDRRGYHKYTPSEIISGKTVDGKCTSPYTRGLLGGRGYNDVIRDREQMLLETTGKRVLLLRYQHTGPRCPCYSQTRGQGRGRCEICFGTRFVPGYIPYVNPQEPLGRILVRFDPYEEDLPLREQGLFQEVSISGWTLSMPILRKRDIFIVYNTDGTEEFRYEVMKVTRNDIFNGEKGAQKFTIKRVDPSEVIYKFDPFKIPDLQDISIDYSGIDLQVDPVYQQLGNEDDGKYANIIVESAYGDGAYSGLFTEGYKVGYQVNFSRVFQGLPPLWAPDDNQDGVVDDGYGPIFYDSNGNRIYFSTPQQTYTNPATNPLEVIAAEKKKQYLKGWTNGTQHGILDAQRELKARGM